MKPKMQDLVQWAEVVSALAIVISLIFVGLQIRQNTRISEVNAYQELIIQISQLNQLKVENPGFAEIYHRLNAGEKLQPGTETEQAVAYLLIGFRHGDLAFRQYKNDLIDEESLNSALSPVRAYLALPLGKEVWADLNPVLAYDYVDYVNKLGPICKQGVVYSHCQGH